MASRACTDACLSTDVSGPSRVTNRVAYARKGAELCCEAHAMSCLNATVSIVVAAEHVSCSPLNAGGPHRLLAKNNQKIWPLVRAAGRSQLAPVLRVMVRCCRGAAGFAVCDAALPGRGALGYTCRLLEALACNPVCVDTAPRLPGSRVNMPPAPPLHTVHVARHSGSHRQSHTVPEGITVTRLTGTDIL